MCSCTRRKDFPGLPSASQVVIGTTVPGDVRIPAQSVPLWCSVSSPRMDMPLTVSVIGVGKIGRKHARILAEVPDVTLGPLVDVDADRAEAVASELGTRTGSLEDALRTADCLFVCTPAGGHAPIALRSIENGLHTFVEKPLANSRSKADQLAAAAAESGGVHAVGHVLRFDPRYQAVRTRVSEAELGDVVAITKRRLVKRARLRRTSDDSSVPLQLGVHDFDLVEWLTGLQIRSITARAAGGALSGEGYDVDEAVSLVAGLEGGATATLTLGFCLPEGHPDSLVSTVLVCTDGTATIDGGSGATYHWDTDGGTSPDTHLWPEVAGKPAGALATQDREFISAVRDGGPPPVSLEAGRRAVQLATVAEDAIENGGWVDVPPH